MRGEYFVTIGIKIISRIKYRRFSHQIGEKVRKNGKFLNCQQIREKIENMGNFMVQQRFELTNFSRESIIRYSPCLDQGDEAVSLIVVGPLSDMAPDS